MNSRRNTLWDALALPPPVVLGAGRTRVRLELVAQGRDLILRIGGGEAHVGAVAVAGPAGPTALTVVPGHKEGPLAEGAAVDLAAAAAGCTCAVIAGIHQDDATGAEIAAIVDNVNEGVAQLAAALREIPKVPR